ncbi:hypothetical protein HDU98_003071 [Podochytrium sp. JEL0797]|nr:hypothetical protein HDU98_003071 [Podochytrium sp. JEL0797]
MITDICRTQNLTCFRIAAEPKNKKNLQTLSRLSDLNDDATSKIPLLFDFYLGMPIMCTKRIPDLKHLEVFANGTICFIIGFAASQQVGSEDPFITTIVDGVVFKQFRSMPKLLWLKVRKCDRILVPGCPPGVVAIPPLELSVSIEMPNNGSLWSPTLVQFPCISALACTPEKLQGVTLDHWITISKLDRHCYQPQTQYVGFSRIRMLKCIRLPFKYRLEYIRKFKPPKPYVEEMIRLIDMVTLPSYASVEITTAFDDWKLEQHNFAAPLLS